MVASFDPGPPVELGTPEVLFPTGDHFVITFDPHPDGERFLVLGAGERDQTRINVVLNWHSEFVGD